MIVLLESIHPEAVDRLAATGEPVLLSGDDATFGDDIPRDEVVAIVTRGRGRIDADLMRSCPELKAVGRCGVGLDNIDTDAAERLGVAVAFAPGVLGGAVAEAAIMLQLAAARQLVGLATAVVDGRWADRDRYEGIEMRGRRLGVVGTGEIGSRVAHLGQALGMEVIAHNRSGVASVPIVELDELFATSDVVQLCVPLTDDTRGFVDFELLGRMRPHAILVNTARGGLIDRASVLNALNSGRLAAYAADVWEPEPPPAEDDLLHHPRTLVTPHVAALTDVTYRKICVRTADAVACVVEGRSADPRNLYRR